MTMYTLPNFCRVCLKYDKNLIDLAHIENEPNETLLTKLEQCVSEVDWTAYKPLLCHPCIKKLNIAFSFKKQCVQSASVLKNYLELVRETQKKSNESQNAASGDNSGASAAQPGAFMVLPNQKFVKILVGPQQNSSFQNVFLNLIPAGLTPIANSSKSGEKESSASNNSKDTNQNIFLNLNSTLQKFIPIAPGKSVISEGADSTTNSTLNQLLTETKTEELSVEIDPTIYGLGEDDDDSESGSNDDDQNDWEDVISHAQINQSVNGEKNSKKRDKGYGSYVPILPKHGDFFSSGQHFLFPANNYDEGNEFSCETCQKSFSCVKNLKQHIKHYHMGRYPYKCEYCSAEYVTKADYELCVRAHKTPVESAHESSITLKDFTNTSLPQITIKPVIDPAIGADGEVIEENGIYPCQLCKRLFSSSTGLLRHKVRKHNQKNKKKYFIKGMKNAKCDICNREFSTQSYMQLHRKLHLRDDVGYKYKVFGKSKYSEKDKNRDSDANASQSDVTGEVESLDVTPDISIMERDEDDQMDGDSSSENDKEEKEVKKDKKSNKTEQIMNPELIIKEEEEDSDDNALQMDIDKDPDDHDEEEEDA